MSRPEPEILRIYQRLLWAFGPQRWWPADSPLEVAVGAILTQNAAWSSVERAIDRIKARRMMDLERLARLSPASLGQLIKPAGLYNVKARRLASLVHWLLIQDGLTGLERKPTAALRPALLGLYGIGPETADSILLYALGRNVFVIGAYTRRILSRYGLIRGNETYAALQALFESSLPHRSGLYGEYHALLVRLAKTHCRARPLCDGCPLA